VRRRVFVVLLLALLIALTVATSASAVSIYAGNTRSPGYGVKADISTPASAPYVGSSGESNWVSTPGPSYWIQAGWRYYSGFSNAVSYYEYSLPIGYHLEDMSSQAWNFTRNYEVSHVGSSIWTVKVNGASKGSWGYLSAPVYPVKACSESHYSTVQLNTQFNNVQYRGTSTWFYFDYAGWTVQSPYWLSITSYYRYRTQGP
jgi:hypothetical protein